MTAPGRPPASPGLAGGRPRPLGGGRSWAPRRGPARTAARLPGKLTASAGARRRAAARGNRSRWRSSEAHFFAAGSTPRPVSAKLNRSGVGPLLLARSGPRRPAGLRFVRRLRWAAIRAPAPAGRRGSGAPGPACPGRPRCEARPLRSPPERPGPCARGPTRGPAPSPVNQARGPWAGGDPRPRALRSARGALAPGSVPSSRSAVRWLSPQLEGSFGPRKHPRRPCSALRGRERRSPRGVAGPDARPLRDDFSATRGPGIGQRG